MCKLVFLIVPALDIDEYAEIVRPWRHANTGPSELGTQLVEPTSSDTLHRAINPKGGNWGMVGSLLCNIRYPDGLVPGIDMPCG